MRISGGRLSRLAVAMLVAAGAAALVPAVAQEGAPEGPPALATGGDEPALISADRVTYDERAGIVTASGNVEISQGGRVLVADSISYDTRRDLVTAEGNVALVELTGDVLFAERMEVTGDLREAFVRDIRVLLSDNSRMAAASGTRTTGNRIELSRAVYSPCNLCAEDPTRAPLWQVKADRAVWDQEAKVVSYHNAQIEFFGLPLLYTPYFEHADPTVQRQTGFLAPTFSTSGPLGFVTQVPYFIVLDDYSDVTLSPIITTKQGVVAQGEYRRIFEKGYLNLSGSGTFAELVQSDGEVKEDMFRGNISAEGMYDINETFRAGFELNRVTDDTYLRVYNLGDQSTLVSQGFVEGFHGRNYGSLRAIAFQTLRDEDNQAEQPLVLPIASYSYVSEPGEWGGVYRMDTSLLSLVRSAGRDTRRLSVTNSWTLPYTSETGEVYTFVASLQTDGYWTNDFDPSDPDNINPHDSRSEFAGRAFPQVAMKWSYPMVRHSETMRQIIEPIGQVVLAPPTGDQDKFPNEDSQDLEFNITNLFALNRFPGIDRVDPGPRIDYGLRWSAMGDGGGYTSIMVGQSYSFIENDVFGPGSGLDDNFSDFVGGVEVSPGPWLNLQYNFRLDKDDYEFRYNELTAYMGVPQLNLEIGYLFTDELLSPQDFEVLPARNELYAQIGSQFTPEWSGFISHRQDIESNIGLSTRVGLQYADECFTIQGIFERSNYKDRELQPDNTVFVRVVLRNIGDFSTN